MENGKYSPLVIPYMTEKANIPAFPVAVNQTVYNGRCKHWPNIRGEPCNIPYKLTEDIVHDMIRVFRGPKSGARTLGRRRPKKDPVLRMATLNEGISHIEREYI